MDVGGAHEGGLRSRYSTDTTCVVVLVVWVRVGRGKGPSRVRSIF